MANFGWWLGVMPFSDCHSFLQEKAKEILSNAPGVLVIDERAANRFPTPLEVSNKDDVAVGRIRRDISQDGDTG